MLRRFMPVSFSRKVYRLRHNMVNYCQVANEWRRQSSLMVPSDGRCWTGRSYCSSEKRLSESEYDVLSDETLDSLAEMFDDLGEKLDLDPEYDVTFSSGVLTVKINNVWGTYVINKQTPNKQIWFSSPKSGPKRYDFDDGVWIYKHDDTVLHKLLNEEISEAILHNVDFTTCSYGRR